MPEPLPPPPAADDGASLDLLLEKLCRGDPEAAEQAFRAYEPLLRQLVGRQLSGALRAKFDSVDVVQSVWADLVDGFRTAGWRFADAAHLRAFLITVTRNRLRDRIRRARPALRHERPLDHVVPDHVPPSPLPRPSQTAQAAEVWERLLALCPPAHRDVLRLRREGLTRAEIAARTGLHEGSVRRILRALARQLALGADGPAA